MENLLKIFHAHEGFARMQELRDKGIQTRTVAKAVSEGIIEKVKPGLYKLVDYPWDEHSGFADVCNSHKKAVICLTSAADYHELTTFNPSYITVAVPHNTPNFKLDYPPIQVYYFPHKYYETGIEEIDTESGLIKIYNQEKTLCDLFRYRNKIGDDIVIESLKNYLKQKKRDINKLIGYANMLGVKEKIFPYIKAIVG
ncbi:MAG: Abortive infection protein AbiEi [Bacteroidetes bacterium]|nr:Abortive infection protein AbiEi [Bacteroidota bacterium]MBU2584515.1 Abortive infection protein AbiEi [Bacteroidota bacterium]